MGRQVILLILLFLINKSLMAQREFSLDEAIGYALEHHPSLVKAELDNKMAWWQYKEALGIGMPHVNGSADYSYFYKVPQQPLVDFITPAVYQVLIGEQVTTTTGTLSPGDIPIPETFNVSFARKQSLNFGINAEVIVFDGNFLKGVKASRKFIDLAAKQIEQTQQDIVGQVAKAYQNVLIAERSLDIVSNNIANVESSLKQTRALYDNGFVEELDVDRLTLSLDNLKTQKMRTRQLIHLSYNVLKFQMAYPLSEDMTTTDELEQVLDILLLEGEMTIDSIDYNNRAEYRLLVDAIILDRLDLDRIRQAYVPSIKAHAGYSQNLARDELFNSAEAGFLPNGVVGLKAKIPIYNGGMTKASIQRKKIVIEQKEIDLVEFQRAMDMQVYNSYIQYTNAKNALTMAQKSLTLNEKIYSKTQIKYNEGVGSSLEVTQAEMSLYNAQAQYINALYDLLLAKTELDIASGEIMKRQ